MESIYDVARYFLTRESMTHKKLQKLCYYAQAWHMANFGVPLVSNCFEAWIHGPVSPDLYDRYRMWGWEPIPQVAEEVVFKHKNTPLFLDKVYEVYGCYTADELESMTHAETPWRQARGGCSASAYSRNPISLSVMRDYYSERMGKNSGA